MDPASATTVRLFGIEFVTDATIDELAQMIADDDTTTTTSEAACWRVVATPNVDHIVRFESRGRERAVAQTAVLALPDGMPVVWASRFLRRPLARRLAGSDLFVEVWRRLVERSVSAVVVASTLEVARRLEFEHPGVQCIVPAIFGEDDETASDRIAGEIAASVADSGARHVVVAIAAPKAYPVADRLSDHRPPAGTSPWVLLVGAAAEFHTGIRPRAPRWMQRSGLEWLNRWAHEPRRLTARYFGGGYRFAGLVWREWRSEGRC